MAIDELVAGLPLQTKAWVRPHFLKTPPCNFIYKQDLTATPEMTSTKIEPDDAFIIVSTDGLFEELTTLQAVSLVGTWFNIKNADANAATWLIRNAIQGGRGSNFLSRMLTAGESRKYRDDMTVQVLFLNGFEKERERLINPQIA